MRAEVRDARLGRMVLTRDGFTVDGSSPYDYPAGNARDSAAHLGIEGRIAGDGAEGTAPGNREVADKARWGAGKAAADVPSRPPHREKQERQGIYEPHDGEYLGQRMGFGRPRNG